MLVSLSYMTVLIKLCSGKMKIVQEHICCSAKEYFSARAGSSLVSFFHINQLDSPIIILYMPVILSMSDKKNKGFCKVIVYSVLHYIKLIDDDLHPIARLLWIKSALVLWDLHKIGQDEALHVLSGQYVAGKSAAYGKLVGRHPSLTWRGREQFPGTNCGDMMTCLSSKVRGQADQGFSPGQGSPQDRHCYTVLALHHISRIGM